MSKEIEQNLDKRTILNKNSSKIDYTIKIDDIISKYRTKLEQLKTNSTENNQKTKSESVIILSNIPKAQILPITAKQSPKIIKENISNLKQNNIFSSELVEEIKNDNIKLQTALTSEKLKIAKLNSQIESYEFELNKAKKEIIELKSKLAYKENELIDQINNINDINNINNSINKDINRIKDENKINKNIIQRFFELFNKNIDLLNKSDLIPFGNNSKIIYLENDYEGKNLKLSLFAIKSIDNLINKLLQDNKELYGQIIELQKNLDQQTNFQRELAQMKTIKEENLILNEQLKSFVKENEIIKNENTKLKNKIKEIKQINNINDYIKNNIDTNYMNLNNINQIYDNFNNKNQMFNINSNKRKSNYFNNYKGPRINNNQNYIQNYNRNDSAGNEYHYNEERSLKNIKDYYNYAFNSQRNSKNKNNNNNKINNYISNNLHNKTFSNNPENRKINLDEISNVNNKYDYNNQNEVRDFSSTEFERPIVNLKNNMMILEQHLKNTSN